MQTRRETLKPVQFQTKAPFQMKLLPCSFESGRSCELDDCESGRFEFFPGTKTDCRPPWRSTDNDPERQIQRGANFMDSRTIFKSLPIVVTSLTAAALIVAGCTSGSTGSASTTQTSETGPAFVIATDAPASSVVSFSVPVSVSAMNSSGTSVPLVSGMPTIDFARFNGLQTLLDMNDVPAGTYTSVVNHAAAPRPSAISTRPAGFRAHHSPPRTPPSSFIFTYMHFLPNPGLAANRLRRRSPGRPASRLQPRQAAQPPRNGQISPAMATPTFTVNAVGTGDSGAYIDEVRCRRTQRRGTQSFFS